MTGWEQAGAGRPPLWVRALGLLGLVASVGLTLYWGFSYSGPYRWLAEWQLEHFGGYRMLMTGLVTLLLSLCGGLLPLMLLVRLVGLQNAEEVSPEALASEQASMEWIQEHLYRLIAAGLSIGIALLGAYLAVTGSMAGARASVEVATLEQGRDPPSHYVELKGRLLMDEAVVVTKRGSSTATAYVPIVSDAWAPGQPVRAYLETFDSWLAKYARDLATGRYEGVLSDLPLPGIAQTGLTERGLPPAERYWVLDYRQTPGEQTALGLGLIGNGAVWGAVTAWIWRRIERKKRKQAA